MGKTDTIYSRLVADERLKSGTAYERLAAIAFMILEEQAVIHDMRLTGESGVQHQIDVTVDADSGQRRILIECKDYNKRIGLGTVRDFFGVIEDTRPDASFMLSTEGFTEPARRYAEAKGIRLAEFRPAQDEDLDGRIRRIDMEFKFSVAEDPRVEWIVDAAEAERLFPEGLPREASALIDELTVLGEGVTKSFRTMLEEATQSKSLPPGEAGVASGTSMFDAPATLSAPGLDQIPVAGFKWSQRWHSATHSLSVGDGIAGLAAELVLKSVDGTIDRVFTNKEIARWGFVAGAEDTHQVSPRGS